MKGIEGIFFYHGHADKNVKITIEDEYSEYTAVVDYEKLIYALKQDLGLEVKE